MKTLVQKLLFGLIFTATGCVTLYKPNAIHSPLLKEKGELNTSGSMGLSGTGLINLQAAYAISNHAGILADGMYHRRQINSADSSVEKLNMFFGEAGAGYFTTFGDKNTGLFQCYSGGGYGFTTDKMYDAGQSYPEVNARYFNIFIQPGLALVNKHIQIAFDLRMNYVNLFNVHASLYDRFEWWNTDFHYYSDTTLSFVNLEPTFTMKAGGEKLKGILQVGVTIPAINSHSYFMVNTSSMLAIPLVKLSVGITYAFGKK
ncbi:MAG: hypothetical protein NTV01_12415 [Bacteroidia bacterium]|nr:hypothetical protein [Bacteroidia bacterium]